jgi:hypothetical protein
MEHPRRGVCEGLIYAITLSIQTNKLSEENLKENEKVRNFEIVIYSHVLDNLRYEQL